jgi:hypothetical protein
MDYQAFTNPFSLFYYYQISKFRAWVLFWCLKQKKLESVFPHGVIAEDEALAGLDYKTREKLIAQDKLKAEKVKDALEKTRLKEVERKTG